MPQSIWVHPLWHGLNGPMVIFPVINVVLAIPKSLYNCQDASNGHISSPWWNAFLRGYANLTIFKFYKPAFYEVFPGTSYSFSNFAFFLLSFLALFPMICVSRFLAPFLFLSPLGIVLSLGYGILRRSRKKRENTNCAEDTVTVIGSKWAKE